MMDPGSLPIDAIKQVMGDLGLVADNHEILDINDKSFMVGCPKLSFISRPVGECFVCDDKDVNEKGQCPFNFGLVRIMEVKPEKDVPLHISHRQLCCHPVMRRMIRVKL